jgi:hypothetical protein
MNAEAQAIEPILKGLLNNNNEERRKNESQILDLMKKKQNRSCIMLNTNNKFITGFPSYSLRVSHQPKIISNS